MIKKPTERNDLMNLVTEIQKIDNCSTKIFHDAENMVEAIYFQDERMKHNFDLFPELILCDATYKVNDKNMPLLVLLVVDGNGESQVAGLFIIKSENAETMVNIFDHFKTVNENHDKIKVILVDKHAANLKTFDRVFPEADIQLCIFHVAQIFNREITTRKRDIRYIVKMAI